MTDTATHLTRPYAADSPLAFLLDLAVDASGPDETEQRDDAETAAAHYVYRAYPYSLAQVVDAMAWQGYPSFTGAGDRRHEPAAVAWLDGGAWLHHTLRLSERDGAVDVLTMIVPCTCGRYTDIGLDTEDVLLEILPELAPTRGRSVHDERAGDCLSVPAAPLSRLAGGWR
jgi:hypothetical protein